MKLLPAGSMDGVPVFKAHLAVLTRRRCRLVFLRSSVTKRRRTFFFAKNHIVSTTDAVSANASVTATALAVLRAAHQQAVLSI